jgi:hypothetical protein
VQAAASSRLGARPRGHGGASGCGTGDLSALGLRGRRQLECNGEGEEAVVWASKGRGRDRRGARGRDRRMQSRERNWRMWERIRHGGVVER